MKTYITKEGETWDQVALNVYGNEKYADYVMSNNYAHLNTIIFDYGTVLKVPDLPTDYSADLPAWRKPNQEKVDTSNDPYAWS